MLKNLLKDTFLYGILHSLNKFFNFLLFFIYMRFISKECISILDMLTLFLGFFSIFISMQLESSFARFYFNEKANDDHYSLLKTIVMLMLIFFILFSLPSYLIFEFLFSKYLIPSSSFIFFLIIFNALLFSITNLINLNFRYSYNYKNFLICTLLFPLTTSILITFFIFTENVNISSIFLSQFISFFLVLVVQLSFTGKSIFLSNFRISLLKDIFKYCLPMFPMFFLLFANDKMIVFFLREFISLKQIADFTVATKYTAILSIIFFALRLSVEPRLLKMISFPNASDFTELKKYFNLYLYLSFFSLIIFILLIPHVGNYFFPQFHNSSDWSSILAFTLIFINLGSYMTVGFGIKKRMDLKFYIVFLQVCFNFIGFYFILKNGYSVSLALKYLVFINYIFLLVQHYISNKLFKVSNEYIKATVLFSLVFLI